MIGVSPTGEIDDIQELIPPKEVLEDAENIDKLTEEIALSPFRVSDALFEYMRSTMTSHYQETGGLDSEYLMISCPRVLAFEQLVVDWAIKLLEKIGKEELFKRSTLASEEAELERLVQSGENNYQLQ